jgi:uncharacterized integral membrane protein
MTGRQRAQAAAPQNTSPPRAAGSKDPASSRRRTRLSGVWVTLGGGAIVLLFLLIFILENGQEVEIAYFGAHGNLPLGVALLLAAVFGVLLVLIPGAGRMLQLRKAARRAAQTPPAPPVPQAGEDGAHNPPPDPGGAR